MAFDGSDGYAAALETVARIFEPRRPLSVSNWAAKYRVLSSATSSEPGRWRNDRIPFLQAIMDSLDPGDPCSMVVFVASSQVGKSECGLNWIGKCCHQSPESFLALFPTEKVGHKWVRARLDGMIASTPELRRIVPVGRTSSSKNTISEKHGPGFVIYIGSANIPDDVASVSVPNLLLDEVDRMPVTLEDEGDPIELALRRQATFPRRKTLATSTPTNDTTSRIWPLWLASSMQRYYVPCPDCTHMQVLHFSHLRWPEGKPTEARYACEVCGSLIDEKHKTEMLAAGEWRAEHPERSGETKGFQITGLYTPIGLGDSWAKHAAAWERSKGRPAAEQVFYNTRLGQVFSGERRSLEWEELYARREGYKLRVLQLGVLLLTAGVDAQGDRLEVQILGHCRGEQIVVVDYQIIPGDPTRDEVWEALDEYLLRPIESAMGVPMRISAVAVDSSNWQHEVINFTRARRARNIFAAKGSSVASRQPIGRPSLVDFKRRGVVEKRGAEQYQLGVSVLKTVVYRRLKSDAGTPEAPVLPSDRHIRFSEDLNEEYFRQLTAETYDPKDGWRKTRNERNEALDTFVYAMAAGMHHSVNVHKLQEADWRRLEAIYEPAVSKPPADGALRTPGGFPIVSATIR